LSVGRYLLSKPANPLYSCGGKGVRVLGAPMDDTSSFRPGTRFATERLRILAPYVEANTVVGQVDPLGACDLGDVVLQRGEVRANLEAVREAVLDLKPHLVLGGEHTITYALLSAYRPDTYIHIDAHLDLRDEWPPSQRMSHATFLRRAVEDGLVKYVIFVAPRAYELEELEYARAIDSTIAWDLEQIDDVLATASGRIHLSVDVDVLDPSQAPGVSTPEASGLTLAQLIDVVLKGVAAGAESFDVVEYNPVYDYNDITGVAVLNLVNTIVRGVQLVELEG